MKKDPKGYEALSKEFFEVTKEKGCDENLCKYVWLALISLNKGYGFNAAHTLAYSVVALQELNLCYKYPIIFWNTANLIVDSGSMNLEDEFDFENEEDNDEKIKNSSADYGRIASAIGKMKATGINFTLPNINKSGITYTPDIENNQIISGLRGITRIGNQLIKDIIVNRPYSSIEDFLSKVKVNKTQMINLIKAGAFDSLYSIPREKIMENYIELISDKKKRITLQNMQMLITKDLIPVELDFEKKLFNFNKYIKKFKEGTNYRLDNIAMKFFNDNYDDSVLTDISVNENGPTALIPQSTWDNTYKKGMEPIRVWIKNNHDEILNQLNRSLYLDAAEKYTEGNISKWEMDSLSFYYHDHELQKLKTEIYGVVDFNSLSEQAEIDKRFPSKDGGEIIMYKINRIAGTVIDKDKNKSQVILLTPSGVVTVKVWKNQFASWDKQISERGEDGKKHVIEKSWFTKGTKLIVTGIRRDDTFVPKKYKSTEWPLFERIDEMDEDGFILTSATERVDEE